MKDYSDEISRIVLSCVSLERAEPNGQRHIPQLVEWSEVVRQLNAFIKNETSGMESEIVALTEQLLEYDSLPAANRIRPSENISGSNRKRKESKIMNT